MSIEFILDENLKKAQDDLARAIKVLDKKGDKDSVFLRRFWFACLKTFEKEAHREVLQRKIQFVSRIKERPKLLPPPPRPVTKMVLVKEGDVV